MMFKHYFVAAVIAAGVATAPATAQGSAEDQFIEAVKHREAAKALNLLRGRPTIVNVRSQTGETPLIIAIARRDEEWTMFLLSQGADPNVAARNGDTPLIAAARIGYASAATELAARKAKIDAANKMGETALIIAVQNRHLPMVRMLLAAGADPDKSDSAAGYSARDYAKRDPRAREILRLIETRKPQP